ncbi:MAG: small multi-drug export protein [Desulfurococcaceae archaeon]|nr:small multi-drug export protein [Desulfurococcaceae archaeon]
MEVWLRYLIVLLLGLAPVSEVRGAVPAARALFLGDGEFLLASTIGLLGNLAVAPAVLYLLDRVEGFVVRLGRLGRLYSRALEVARRRGSEVSGYGVLGLTVFVAIPLPATGAWTGSLAAYILGLPRGRAVLAIELGVLIAFTIVLGATVLGLEVLKAIFMLT